jgi:polysaccharide pyruvyl transferase WcaK-like protein
MGKKIALFGFFGWGNLGNTGTLQTFLHHLRRRIPDAEVWCICANPEEVAKQFQIPVFPIDLAPRQLWYRPTNPLLRLVHLGLLRIPLEAWLWLKAYLFLQSFDLLLIPGTGVLDDYGVGPFQTPYDLFKWCLVAKVSGTKLFFVSVGAGPIVHKVSRWFMKAALGLADYRSYRDQLSQTYMHSIGFQRKDNGVYPDLMFSLPLATDLHPHRRSPQPRVVGLGVMAYYGWNRPAEEGEAIYQTYLAKIGQFAVWLVENNYSVRLLIGQSHDRRVVDDLKSYVERVYGTPAPGQLISEPINTIEDLFHQLDATDIVVATRFHNVLCALMLNKPVLSLGYAQKNDVLMAEMGLDHYCQQIEEFSVERLIVQFTELATNAGRIGTHIACKNSEYRTALDQQYKLIVQGV